MVGLRERVGELSENLLPKRLRLGRSLGNLVGMEDTSAVAVADVEGAAVPEKKKRKVPGRKRRYSFYEDGKDHVLLTVARNPDGSPVPNGALSPVAGVPRFESAKAALDWIESESGDKLTGLTVLVAKMEHNVAVVVENKPTVTMQAKQKFMRESAKPEAVPA